MGRKKHSWGEGPPWHDVIHSTGWQVSDDSIGTGPEAPRAVVDKDLAMSYRKRQRDDIEAAKSFAGGYRYASCLLRSMKAVYRETAYQLRDHFPRTQLDIKNFPEGSPLTMLNFLSCPKGHIIFHKVENELLPNPELHAAYAELMRRGALGKTELLSHVLNCAVKAGMVSRDDYVRSDPEPVIIIGAFGPEMLRLYDEAVASPDIHGRDIGKIVGERIRCGATLYARIGWNHERAMAFIEDGLSEWDPQANRVRWIGERGDAGMLAKQSGKMIAEAAASIAVLMKEYDEAMRLISLEMAERSKNTWQIREGEYVVGFKKAGGRRVYQVVYVKPEEIHRLEFRQVGEHNITGEYVKAVEAQFPSEGYQRTTKPPAYAQEFIPRIIVDGGIYTADWAGK